MEKQYRYYDKIMVLFVAVLMISNIVATKIFKVFVFNFSGGVILFPISYIFGDILTEVYGYARSRAVIWMGFFCSALLVGVVNLVGWLPPGQGWTFQKEYEIILGSTGRIVLASFIAYLAGEFVNSFLMARMKIMTRGRWLWMRTIGSTIVGEGIDTVLFVTIAFAGILPSPLLFSVILSNYLFKCGFEVVVTPVTYQVVKYLKKKENEDYYDYATDFNPFRLK
jgi:uncharacterized integral membrane protein (TIGR00697 family)